MAESTGQLNRGTAFGELLYNLAGSPDVMSIVEIGTWNGLGSTRCFIDGIADSGRGDVRFISLEANKEMYHRAMNNIQQYLAGSTFNCVIELMNGTIISPEEFPPFDSSSMVKEWYDADISWCASIPNVYDQLPDRIDLLLIDGGEYTGFAEFSKLRDRSRIIALDDVNTYKCKAVRDTLLSDKEFECIVNVSDDRNGYAVFKRK